MINVLRYELPLHILAFSRKSSNVWFWIGVLFPQTYFIVESQGVFKNQNVCGINRCIWTLVLLYFSNNKIINNFTRWYFSPISKKRLYFSLDKLQLNSTLSVWFLQFYLRDSRLGTTDVSCDETFTKHLSLGSVSSSISSSQVISLSGL